MKESKIIDSSIWIAYLFNGLHSDIIDMDEMLLLCALSIFEIKKKLLKSNIETSKITKSIEFIKKRSLIIEVNDEIAERAVDFSIEKKLPIIDSLIYATAVLNKAILITSDNDFRSLKDVVII